MPYMICFLYIKDKLSHKTTRKQELVSMTDISRKKRGMQNFLQKFEYNARTQSLYG